MENLKGKVAWVTGAGSGIGEAGAVALAQRRRDRRSHGAGARRRWRRWPSASMRRAAARPWCRQADVTKAAAVGKIAEAIRAEHGRLDILVNNAGTNIPNRIWAAARPRRHRHRHRRQPDQRVLCRPGGAADHAGAEGRRDDPHRLVGRPPHRADIGAGLHRGQARHGGHEPHHQPRGGHERHPLLGAVPGRGGDADPAQPADPGDARDHGAHDPAAGHGRADRLHRPPAGARVHQRGADHPDPQPRLHRHHAGAGRARRPSADGCRSASGPAARHPGSAECSAGLAPEPCVRSAAQDVRHGARPAT